MSLLILCLAHCGSLDLLQCLGRVPAGVCLSISHSRRQPCWEASSYFRHHPPPCAGVSTVNVDPSLRWEHHGLRNCHLPVTSPCSVQGQLSCPDTTSPIITHQPWVIFLQSSYFIGMIINCLRIKFIGSSYSACPLVDIHCICSELLMSNYCANRKEALFSVNRDQRIAVRTMGLHLSVTVPKNWPHCTVSITGTANPNQ